MKRLWNNLFSQSKSARRSVVASNRFTPSGEVLEDRFVPSGFSLAMDSAAWAGTAGIEPEHSYVGAEGLATLNTNILIAL